MNDNIILHETTRWNQGLLIVICVFLILTLSCTDTTAPEAETGTLIVNIETDGPSFEMDRFNLRITELNQNFDVAPTDTLKISDISAGTYTIVLTVAENCTVNKSPLLRATIETGSETSIDFTVECQTTWWRRLTAPSQRELAIVFRDSFNGFIVPRTRGGGTATEFFITNDGGESWSLRSTTNHDNPLDIGTFLHFVNDDIALTGGNFFSLLRTDNAGLSWSVSGLSGDRRWLLTAYFMDESNGFVAGSGGMLFRTGDGGLTWNFVETPIDTPITGIFFSDALTGVFVGFLEDPGFVLVDLSLNEENVNKAYYTTDGGDTWEARPTTGAPGDLQGLSFATNEIGVAVGDKGAIVRTTDGGFTWSPLDSPVSTTLWAVDFGTDGFGVAVGDDSVILVTEDYGATWRREESVVGAGLFSRVSVLDKNNTWVTGPGELRRLVTVEGNNSP